MKETIKLKNSTGVYVIDYDKRKVTYTFKAYKKYFSGTAVCSSVDNFEKERGMQIAYLKAVKEMKHFYLFKLNVAKIFLSDMHPCIKSEVEKMINGKIFSVTTSIQHINKKLKTLC